MLISARRLVDRLRHGRTRADEIADVRRRIAASPSPAAVPAEERALAADLLRLREALSAAFPGVDSCTGCARGHPLPHGRWRGGHCCGGRTDGVFTDDEIAALRLSGTTPGRLAPPEGDHAGCAFRGPEGCSLGPADRPNICVRYVCHELDAELRERGDLRAIRALAEELGRTFERFRRLRAARREAETSGALDEDGP